MRGNVPPLKRVPYSPTCGEQVHRNLISPPSSWPGCELQKYHYRRSGHRVIRVPPAYQCSLLCLPRRWIAAHQIGNVGFGDCEIVKGHRHGDGFINKYKLSIHISNASFVIFINKRGLHNQLPGKQVKGSRIAPIYIKNALNAKKLLSAVLTVYMS